MMLRSPAIYTNYLYYKFLIYVIHLKEVNNELDRRGLGHNKLQGISNDVGRGLS